MKTLKELLEGIYVAENRKLDYGFVSSLCIDSRKCKPHSLFVAISGDKNDGHNFIDEAVGNGAGTVICEKSQIHFIRE